MFLLHVYIVAGRKTGVEKKKSDKGSGELCFTRQLIFFFESAEFACITVFLVVFFDQSTLTDVKLKKIKQLNSVFNLWLNFVMRYLCKKLSFWFFNGHL